MTCYGCQPHGGTKEWKLGGVLLKYDILYLGVNMGNAAYRFFERYPEGEEDYYDTFRWLVRLKKERPELSIGIKHHPGDYDHTTDSKEHSITDGKGIDYLPSQDDSYELARKAGVVVSYCSTMILEFAMPNLAKYLYRIRHRRWEWKTACKGHISRKPIEGVGAYYLDPEGRNRQFCSHIDDVCVHDCMWCINPPYLEVYNPYRLTTYNQFKEVVG